MSTESALAFESRWLSIMWITSLALSCEAPVASSCLLWRYLADNGIDITARDLARSVDIFPKLGLICNATQKAGLRF